MISEKGKRIAASRLGITVTEYEALRAAGLNRCSDCRTWQPVTRFGLNKKSASGYQNICRSCAVERTRQWRTGVTTIRVGARP